MRRFPRLLAFIALLLAPAAAAAEWKEATSANFVVHSEGGEAQLREFTTKLEKLHFAMRALHNIDVPPGPVRLRVYLMRNVEEVQRTFPYPAGGVAGYYENSGRGPMMVGTRTGGRGDDELDPESILLHEYAHHFMYQYFPATYPTWYSEGFAEFFGGTQIGEDDVILVGVPARHRYGSFWSNRWMPISKLLTAQSYRDAGGDVDLLYAQGWLLVHYLFSHEPRSGQLGKYLTAINAGKSYEQAMDEAFGKGAGKLNSELFDYAGRSKLSGVRLPFKKIDVGPIAVRTLSPAEQALVMQEIQLGQGVLARYAEKLAEDVRDVARRHPNDPYVLSRLVEAERAARNDAGALAAVERLLQAKPDDPRGLMHKGMLQIAALRASGSSDEAAWKAARALIVRANRATPDDPLILEAFYDSYTAQSVQPPTGAQNALYKALELAPGDEDIRYKLAADFEQRGMLKEAVTIIRPSAFELPHGESEREKRRRERQEEKWRLAGKGRRESAREMYDRLQQKLGQPPAKPPAAATGG